MNGEKRRFSFSLRIKLMLFTTILALITYSTSIFFIYALYDYMKALVSQTIYTVVVMLLGVMWSGILAYFAASFIVKPLRKLEEAVHKAAAGDIGQDVPLPQTDDEIRSLSIAFNSMLENLRTMVQNIDTTFMDTNLHVQQIRSQTSEAAAQAKGVSATIDEISCGAGQTATSIQEIVFTINQTITLASHVEEKAKQSEQLSSQMVQALEQSTQVFVSLIEGIQQLARENEQSMNNVQQLEEHTKKMESIISFVSEIATQTNLLALNASIEAARAGEHGRGFAVVAEEVRKLADESANSTQSISGLLHSMQAEVNHVVNHMKEQVKTAKEEAKRGEETELILHEMNTSIMQVANAIKRIGEYMSQQMEHIQSTGAQTKEVAAIAEEASAGAQEVSRVTRKQTENITSIDESAQNLEIRARELKSTIEQFTL
ncbi:methyl-accepting chemotaxis protein [Microbacteriaceae bacterium 4G12]